MTKLVTKKPAKIITQLYNCTSKQISTTKFQTKLMGVSAQPHLCSRLDAMVIVFKVLWIRYLLTMKAKIKKFKIMKLSYKNWTMEDIRKCSTRNIKCCMINKPNRINLIQLSINNLKVSNINITLTIVKERTVERLNYYQMAAPEQWVPFMIFKKTSQIIGISAKNLALTINLPINITNCSH